MSALNTYRDVIQTVQEFLPYTILLWAVTLNRLWCRIGYETKPTKRAYVLGSSYGERRVQYLLHSPMRRHLVELSFDYPQPCRIYDQLWYRMTQLHTLHLSFDSAGRITPMRLPARLVTLQYTLTTHLCDLSASVINFYFQVLIASTKHCRDLETLHFFFDETKTCGHEPYLVCTATDEEIWLPLAALSKLRTLWFPGQVQFQVAALTSLATVGLHPIPTTKDLCLHVANFTPAHVEALGPARLRLLDLPHTLTDEWVPAILAHRATLERLDATEFHIQDIGFLAQLTQLRTLHLEMTTYPHSMDWSALGYTLAPLVSLHRFYLSHPTITDAQMAHLLSCLPSLLHLKLASCDALRSLAWLPLQLESFNLCNGHIPTIEFTHLGALRRLQRLTLYRCCNAEVDAFSCKHREVAWPHLEHYEWTPSLC